MKPRSMDPRLRAYGFDQEGQYAVREGRFIDHETYTGYCWIGQSGMQSILLDWIVIDNTISKLDFDLDWQSSKATSIQIQRNQ